MEAEKDEKKQAIARMAFKNVRDWIQRRPSSVFQQRRQSENRRDDREIQGYDVRGCNSIFTQSVVSVLSAKHAMTPLPVSPISSGSDFYLTRAVNNALGGLRFSPRKCSRRRLDAFSLVKRLLLHHIRWTLGSIREKSLVSLQQISKKLRPDGDHAKPVMAL